MLFTSTLTGDSPMKTLKTITDYVTPILAVLALALPLSACDLATDNGVSERGGPENGDEDEDGDGDEDGEEEEEDYPEGSICAAAEAVDDTCEEAFGEDAAECMPFDDVDEACEAGQVSEDDACSLAEALDDSCEELFGEDVAECAALDAIDEACETDEEDDEG
jgi:hypothetical protein